MPNRFGTVAAFAFGVLVGAIIAVEVVVGVYVEDEDVVGYRWSGVRAVSLPSEAGLVFLVDGGIAEPWTRTFTAGEDNVELYCDRAHTIHCSCPIEAFLDGGNELR